MPAVAQAARGRGFTLRPYQAETLDKIRALYDEGTNRQLVAAATGIGKTVKFSFLPERFPELFEHGMMVLVHRRELVFQAAKTLRKVWPYHRVEIEMSDYRASANADIVVASIQTLAHPKSERLLKYRGGRIGILVIDEAHHCSSGSQYHKVCDHFGVGPEKQFEHPSGDERLLVGVTATPNRHDGEGLHAFFDDIAANLDIRWGIENGWLCDIHAKRIQTGTDISHVSTRAGDFASGELQDAINTHERHEVIVKAFQEHGGRQGLAFTAGVDQAHTLAAAFEEYGIGAAAIDGSMEKPDRKRIVDAFRSGDLQILTNCNVATEGFDAPSVDTLLMARPTKSTPLYTQMIGRGTRPVINPTQAAAEERIAAIRASNKPYMQIIDFTDNTGKHDLMTAPKLFGLDQEFEADGSLMQAVEHVEALEKENPGKPFRKAKSLDEIEIIAESISVWDVAETVEHMDGVSDLQWMQLGQGMYQLQVPHEVTAGGETMSQDVILRLESDRLGRYCPTIIKRDVWRDGKRVVPGAEQASDKKYASKEEAIRACDAFVRRDFPEALPLISREQSWHDKDATEGQLSYLKSLNVHIPDGYDLTRGKASRLINAAKAQQSA